MKKSFNQKCYNLLRIVPKGKVTTYKAIAERLDSKGYRAVGNAMNKNPNAFSLTQSKGGMGGLGSVSGKGNTPCHRVINSDGKLGGFATGIRNKIRLLKAEGVDIKNGKVDLERYEFKF